MIEWFDKHFVEGWRESWKWVSVQFAALFGALLAAVSSNPQILFTVLNYMPADPTERALFASAIGLAAFFAPWILRVWNQQKAKTDGASAAE